MNLKLYFKFIQKQIRLMSINKPKNHYDSLGISSNSTQGEVKSAYYKLSMQYHPDRSKSAESSEKFRDITEAYEVLGNAKTRRLYDKGFYSSSTVTAHDTANRFHKSRETRSRPPPPTGRTPIYDFDEWSRSHYGATFQRQMAHKERLKVKRVRREQEANDIKMEKLFFWLIVMLFACTYLSQKNDYDKVSYDSTSPKPQHKD